MSTTSEIVKDVLAIADTIGAAAYNADPWSAEKNITASLLRAAAARLSELERENAALRGALKPFIRECRSWDDDAPDDTEVWCSQGRGWEPIQSYFTLGDLRRAAALAGSGEK